MMIPSSRGLVQFMKRQLPGLFLCPLIDVLTGGLSHGWLHRMPLVLRCITFLQMILNHSAAWPIFKVQVVRVQHESDGVGLQLKKKSACLCFYLQPT